MITHPDYEQPGMLAQDAFTITCRARRRRDGQPLLYTTARDRQTSEAHFDLLRREYEIASQIYDSKHGLHPIAFETREGRPFLLRADRATRALSERITERTTERLNIPANERFSGDEIIAIARDVLFALDPLHQQRFFHGNLRPEAVWYLANGDAETRLCGLAGFGAAAGDARYLAPERTERVARAADYRCDYYGLGLLIFELATGRPPFAGADAAATIHAHLTETPPTLDQFRADLPAMLTAITRRLLAKHPEERYETSYGILRDLDACEASARNGTQGDAAPIVTGRHDRAAVFRIPQTLFGREQEFEALRGIVGDFAHGHRDANSNVDADADFVGSARLLLITGEAGSGKSALMQALRTAIESEHDQIRIAGGRQTASSRTPYEVLNQVLRDLVRSLLHLNGAEFARWRERLAGLPGDGLALLADIPEAAPLLRPESIARHHYRRSAAARASPAEREQRLQLAMLELTDCFATRERPLILFLDDLHWLDPASGRALEAILERGRNPHLLMIAAARTATDERNEALDRLTRNTGPERRCELGALSAAAARDILTHAAPTLRNALEIAAECLRRSRGNALVFVQQLRALHRDETLRFDPKQERWVCDLQDLQSASPGFAGAAFLAKQIAVLPPATRALLEAAACIGREFFADDILMARPDLDPARISQELGRALQEDLIVPCTPAAPAGTPAQLRYRFAHDRIREAAYAGLADEERAALHHAIGSALYAPAKKRKHDRANARRGAERSLPDEFEVFEQLRRGRACLRSPRDRGMYLRAGLQATRRARLAGAHETAFGSVRDALAMLPEQSRDRMNTIAWTLHLEAAELAYLNHETDLADRYFATLLRHARSDDDRIRALKLKIVAANHVARFDAAIEAGLSALRIAGVKLQYFQTPKLIASLLGMRRRLRGASVEDLSRLPVLNDARTRRVLELCMHLIPPAFLANRSLAILCGLKMLSIALKFGNSPVAYSAYGMYAAILSLVWRDYPAAYRFGRLSLELCEGQNNPAFHANALFGAGVFTVYWGEALDASREMFERGLRESMRCSDLVYAAYNARVLIGVWIMGGTPLPAFADGLRRLRELSYKIQDPDLSLLIRIAETRLRALAEDGHLSAKATQDFHLDLKTEPARGYHALFFLEAACLLNTADVAQTSVVALSKLDEFLTSGFYFADALLFRGLVLARYDRSNFWNRRRLRGILKRLRKYAAVNDANFSHRVQWLSAELARLKGEDDEAVDLYDQASETAGANGFPHHAAAIAESAGRFHFARRNMSRARACLRRAHDGFRRWGAKAKARGLAAEFSGWFVDDAAARAAAGIVDADQLARLDLETVLGAAQSILGEIRLTPLLERLMPGVLQSSGADRGALLFESDGELRLEALATPESIRILAGQAIPRSAGQAGDLPLDLFRFVSRSGRLALAGAPNAEYNFSGDSYFKRRRPAAAMALPLVYQGRSRGVLYLENSITREAFSEKRVALLGVLSGQIASAVENARLYRDTEILGATVSRLLDATRAISRSRTPAEAALTAIDFAREFLSDELRGHCIYLFRSPQDGWLKIDSLAGEDVLLGVPDFQAEVDGYSGGHTAPVSKQGVEYRETPRPTVWISVRVADQPAAVLRLDLTQARAGNLNREREALEGMTASLALTFDLLGRKEREKLAMVGELASEIVHDIHNHAHLIERGRELAAAGQPEYFELIREETQQLFGMSRDILDFAGERMLLNRRDIELAQFADEVRRKLEVFFKGRDVRVELNLHGAGRVALDRERMLRVLINLAKNAGEAMPDGGEFQVAIYLEDGLLYIACRDTGTGIRPELQENLFQAFVSHGKSGGSGLGLAVAERVVRAHGGSIQLESEPGAGSCFRLVLPLREDHDT